MRYRFRLIFLIPQTFYSDSFQLPALQYLDALGPPIAGLKT